MTRQGDSGVTTSDSTNAAAVAILSLETVGTAAPCESPREGDEDNHKGACVQGQRTLNPLRRKDLHQELIAQARDSALSFDAAR